jgi:8-oxo-dGTP pyrophosphatase MutT (NUDIX family)
MHQGNLHQKKEVRPASTLVLVKNRSGKIEVNLVRRSEQSGFMAGKYVFPGGTVNHKDRMSSIWMEKIDLNPQEITERLGGGLLLEEIIAHGVSVIRETFEESGVLLGNHASDSILSAVSFSQLSPDFSFDLFEEVINSRSYILQFSKLYRWGRWITPELMQKRYDTLFFISIVPEDTCCRPDSVEVTESIWIAPEDALKGNLIGEIPLSPPTLVTLHELMQIEGIHQLQEEIQGRPWGNPLLPRMVIFDAGSVIIEPWDPEYRKQKVIINRGKLEESVMPAGASFSRIWYDGHVWRPVSC